MVAPNSIKFFADLSKLVVDGMNIVKSKNIWAALSLIPEVQSVIMDAKDALPELSHLSEQDAMDLSKAAYDCIKKIVDAA